VQYWNEIRELVKSWDFMGKIDKKTPFSGVIFKYAKKYHFNVQHLTHFFNEKLTIALFLGMRRANLLVGFLCVNEGFFPHTFFPKIWAPWLTRRLLLSVLAV